MDEHSSHRSPLKQLDQQCLPCHGPLRGGQAISPNQIQNDQSSTADLCVGDGAITSNDGEAP